MNVMTRQILRPCAVMAILVPLAATAQLPTPPPPPPPPPVMAPPSPPASPSISTPSAAPVAPPPSSLDPAERDPFWPIGYRPAERAPTPSVPTDPLPPRQPEHSPQPPSPLRWNEAREQLRIGGFFRIGDHTSAYINNVIVSPGDLVTVSFEGREYRWRVETIEPHAIRLRPYDSRVIAPFQPPKPEGFP